MKSLMIDAACKLSKLAEPSGIQTVSNREEIPGSAEIVEFYGCRATCLSIAVRL